MTAVRRRWAAECAVLVLALIAAFERVLALRTVALPGPAAPDFRVHDLRALIAAQAVGALLVATTVVRAWPPRRRAGLAAVGVVVYAGLWLVPGIGDWHSVSGMPG